MIRIFLGSPPPHIEAWIKANFKPKAKWVPENYTSDWQFSDHKSYDIQYTTYNPGDPYHPEGFTDWYLVINNGAAYYGTSIIGQPDIPQHATTLSFDPPSESYTVYASRYFTPGHWEDANGNWINGSWDSETTMTAVYDPNHYGCQWIKKGQMLSSGSTADKSGWYAQGQTLLSTNKNANMIISYSNAVVFSRTWTNTTPAPSN